MNSAIALFLSLLIHTVLFSQAPLRVNSVVPDLKFKQLLHGDREIKLSDFKGKYILLDFFSKNCTSCIQNMPSLAAFQEKYKDQLQVIALSHDENPEKVVNLFNRIKALKDLKLLVVQATPEATKLFPHAGVPFTVLLDNERKVRSIPGWEYLTEKQFEAIIKDKNLKAPEAALLTSEISRKSFWEQGWLTDSTLLYSTVLTKHVRGVSINSKINLPGDRLQLTQTSPLAGLYAMAYYQSIKIFDNEWKFRVVLEQSQGPELLNTRYCYQAIVPDYTKTNGMGYVYEYLKQDLFKYFQYNVRVEKRKFKYYSISTNDTTSQYSLPIGGENESYTLASADNIEFSNEGLRGISIAVGQYYLTDNLVSCESKSRKRYNFSLPRKVKDLEELKRLLLKQGIFLTEKEEERDFLILTPALAKA